MSLDVHITLEGAQQNSDGSGIFVRQNGQTKEISRAEWDEKFPGREPVIFRVYPHVSSEPEEEVGDVYHGNITHNLNEMAGRANIYMPLWRPEEIGIRTAQQLIEPLTNGLRELKENPEFYKKFNPKNGWGTYETLIEFVEEYLEACKKYPQGKIDANR